MSPPTAVKAGIFRAKFLEKLLIFKFAPTFVSKGTPNSVKLLRLDFKVKFPDTSVRCGNFSVLSELVFAVRSPLILVMPWASMLYKAYPFKSKPPIYSIPSNKGNRLSVWEIEEVHSRRRIPLNTLSPITLAVANVLFNRLSVAMSKPLIWISVI